MCGLRKKPLVLIIGSLVALLIIALPVVGINKEKLVPYINDPLRLANNGSKCALELCGMLVGHSISGGIFNAVFPDE